MDGTEVVSAPGDPHADASGPPLALQLALWFPAFFVLVWFMHRLFSGRWLTDPEPTYGLGDAQTQEVSESSADREDPRSNP